MDDAELFRSVYPLLRRFAAAVSSLPADPDDLVQEATARTLRNHRLADLDDPVVYLRRVIVNVARDDHRRDGRRADAAQRMQPVEGRGDSYPSDFEDVSRLSVEQRAVLFTEAAALPSVEERDQPRSRRWQVAVVVAAIVVVAIVASTILVRSASDVDVQVTPPPAPTTAPPVLPRSFAPIEVPTGSRFDLRYAFGRVWVTAGERGDAAQSRVMSFDPSTGRMLTDSTVTGSAYGLVATDRNVWVRSTTSGPASFTAPNGRGDNMIFRVDPATGTATGVHTLDGDGPVAASSGRVAAADRARVVILDDTTELMGTREVLIAVPVGTNIGGLAFDDTDASLYAVHASGGVIRIDATAGKSVATSKVDPGGTQFGPSVAVAAGRLWLNRGPGAVVTVAVPFSDGFDSAIAVEEQLLGRAPPTPFSKTSRGDIVFISDNAMHIVETDAAGRAPLVDRTVPVDPTWSNSPVIVGDDVWLASWLQDPTGQSVTVTFKPADPTGDRVVVPDVTGRNVGEARAALNGAGLSAGIDPSIDSDDAEATVVAQEPPAGQTVDRGATVGLRTAAPVPDDNIQCPNAVHRRRSNSADVLPPEGQTTLDRVRGLDLSTIRARHPTVERVLLAHRDGDVWTSDGRIVSADDYWLVAYIDPVECPASPEFHNSVPVVFVPQGGVPSTVTTSTTPESSTTSTSTPPSSRITTTTTSPALPQSTVSTRISFKCHVLYQTPASPGAPVGATVFRTDTRQKLFEVKAGEPFPPNWEQQCY